MIQDDLSELPLHGRPVAYFHYFYSDVVRQVRTRVTDGELADPAFLSHLVVERADRYFDALRAGAGGATTPAPECWLPLLGYDAGPNRRSAVAVGLTANLTFDLPLALTATCAEFGVTPQDGTDQHADYRLLVDAFGASLPSRGRSLQRWQLLVETTLGSFNPHQAQASGDYARDVAWRSGRRLWRIRRRPADLHRSRSRLDSAVRTVADLLASPYGGLFR